MQNHKDLITLFWQDYLTSLPEQERGALKLPESWPFGDGEAMADELGALVATGIKTATASLLWEYEAEGSQMPKAGDLSIILDGRGMPICLIETTEVQVKPFNQVNAGFAYDEGEGDRTLAYWREVHWRFFGRTCAQIGREPAEDMPVVCERFRLVWLPGV